MDLLPSAYYQFCVRACISFRIWGWLHAAPLVVPPLSPGREDGQLFVDLIFFAVATLACVISWVDVTYGAEPGAAKFIGMLTGVVLGNRTVHLKLEPSFSPTACFQPIGAEEPRGCDSPIACSPKARVSRRGPAPQGRHGAAGRSLRSPRGAPEPPQAETARPARLRLRACTVPHRGRAPSRRVHDGRRAGFHCPPSRLPAPPAVWAGPSLRDVRPGRPDPGRGRASASRRERRGALLAASGCGKRPPRRQPGRRRGAPQLSMYGPNRL